jgi:hypothetical protein
MSMKTRTLGNSGLQDAIALMHTAVERGVKASRGSIEVDESVTAVRA